MQALPAGAQVAMLHGGWTVYACYFLTMSLVMHV